MSKISWVDDQGVDHIVVADITSSLAFQKSATLTQSPAEAGSNVTDHVIYEPEVLSLQLQQTQTPIQEGDPWTNMQDEVVDIQVPPSLFRPGGLLAITSFVGGQLTNLAQGLGLESEDDKTPKITVLTAETEEDRITLLQEELISLIGTTPVDIEVSGREYFGRILISLNYVREAGQLGVFSLDFQEFRTVSTRQAEKGTLPTPLDLKNKASQDKGNRTPTKDSAASENASSGEESFLSSLVPPKYLP